MYALASQLGGLPIISLQTGETVAWLLQPIIDIGALEIRALRCDAPGFKHPQILMTADIRQFAADCLIVDSEDELSDPDDLVRLRDIVKSSYDPLRKQVVSDTGRKLGVVVDFSVNLESNRVQKLHIRQSLLQSWLGTTLIIDRTQIIDVTQKQITVRDSTAKSSALPTDPLPESPS